MKASLVTEYLTILSTRVPMFSKRLTFKRSLRGQRECVVNRHFYFFCFLYKLYTDIHMHMYVYKHYTTTICNESISRSMLKPRKIKLITVMSPFQMFLQVVLVPEPSSAKDTAKLRFNPTFESSVLLQRFFPLVGLSTIIAGVAFPDLISASTFIK